MNLLRNAPPAIELDFSPSPRRRPGGLGWALLAVGVLALGLAAYEWRMAEEEVDERERIVDRLKAEVQQGAKAPGAAARILTAQELEPANRVADLLNADWAGLFSQLGAGGDDQVALLELQADAARGLFRALGQAPSLEQAFEYLRALQRKGVLRDPRIDSHEWVTIGQASVVVRFTVTANWGGER